MMLHVVTFFMLCALCAAQDEQSVIDSRTHVIRHTDYIVRLISYANGPLADIQSAITALDMPTQIGVADAAFDASDRGSDLRQLARGTKGKFSRLNVKLTDLNRKTQALADELTPILDEIKATQTTPCDQNAGADGYYTGADNCYYFDGTHKNWDDARADCQSRGMDLAAILSQAEQDYLVSVIDSRSDSPQDYWLSARRDADHEFVWYSLFDLPLEETYTNWHPGEPNDAGGNEDCTSIWSNRQWNDYPCDRGQPFICQY